MILAGDDYQCSRNLLVNRADISATGSLAIMKRQYAVI